MSATFDCADCTRSGLMPSEVWTTMGDAWRCWTCHERAHKPNYERTQRQHMAESVKAKYEAMVAKLHAAQQVSNRLSDVCGALKTERDELLRENAVLRRRIEKLERRR